MPTDDPKVISYSFDDGHDRMDDEKMAQIEVRLDNTLYICIIGAYIQYALYICITYIIMCACML